MIQRFKHRVLLTCNHTFILHQGMVPWSHQALNQIHVVAVYFGDNVGWFRIAENEKDIRKSNDGAERHQKMRVENPAGFPHQTDFSIKFDNSGMGSRGNQKPHIDQAGQIFHVKIDQFWNAL